MKPPLPEQSDPANIRRWKVNINIHQAERDKACGAFHVVAEAVHCKLPCASSGAVTHGSFLKVKTVIMVFWEIFVQGLEEIKLKDTLKYHVIAS